MFAHLNNALNDELTPMEFYLGQNYPNPFIEKTLIKYCIGYRTKVILKVYDSDGKVIEKLVDEDQNPGTYEIEFTADHSRESGNPEEGTFFYRLVAGDYRNEKKMSLQKNFKGG